MRIITLLFILLSYTLHAAEFPQIPDPELTPGKLCQNPSVKRYAERINYCARDVSRDLKQEIFSDYRKLGFTLNPSKRQQFKIDHLIPLCAGGSNNRKNLWPQHQSIYIDTDQIEHIGCEKLAQNKIKQKELIVLILSAKKNHAVTAKILREIKFL